MLNQILILLGLLMLSAIFSGTELALVSLNDVKVRALLEKKRQGARTLARLKSKPQKLIITILIGNNIVNIGASAYVTFLITNLVGSKGVGIATGVMTFLVLLFGEIIPKSFAARNTETIALMVARPLEVLQFVLSPLIWIFDILSKIVLLFTRGSQQYATVTERELRIMAQMGAEEGTILKQEREMLENVFKLNDITAEDVMTPRMRMFALDQELHLSDVLPSITKAPYSRVPIYKKNRDNITGILYLRDLLVHLANKHERNIPIKELAKKPFFVPKEKSVDELFKDFQEQNIHIAIVLDGRGGTEGVVTLEDLLEELVGEIIDESDISRELIMRVDKNTILVDGSTELKMINRFLNVRIPGEELEEISEVLLRELGKIPQKGEMLHLGNLEFEVMDVTEKKINRVKIIKLPHQQANPVE